jgi:hypothetical protein
MVVGSPCIARSLTREQVETLRADAALIVESVCGSLRAERIICAGEGSRRRLACPVRTVAARKLRGCKPQEISSLAKRPQSWLILSGWCYASILFAFNPLVCITCWPLYVLVPTCMFGLLSLCLLWCFLGALAEHTCVDFGRAFLGGARYGARCASRGALHSSR